jgi:hypothetical protein
MILYREEERKPKFARILPFVQVNSAHGPIFKEKMPTRIVFKARVLQLTTAYLAHVATAQTDAQGRMFRNGRV